MESRKATKQGVQKRILLGVAIFVLVAIVTLSHVSPGSIIQGSIESGSSAHWKCRTEGIPSTHLPCDSHDAAVIQASFNDTWQPASQCQPIHNIYYLKQHKTGSSVLTTMLFRYIYSHDLKVVPLKFNVYPSKQIEAQFTNLSLVTSKQFNIFCDHTVYDEAQAAKIMPENTTFFTSLRHPFPHMKSLFVEFGVPRRLKINSGGEAVETFLNDLDKYSKIKTTLPPSTMNMMSLEFGFNPRKLNTMEEISNMLEYIDSHFRFIVINEYFIESLVLLKRTLCWETRDIIHTSMRARSYQGKDHIPSQNLLEIHRNYSTADYVLYDYYLKKFLHAYHNEHNGIAEEVYQFKAIQKRIGTFCKDVISKLMKNNTMIYKMVEDNNTIKIDPRPWGSPFHWTVMDCALCQMETAPFRNLLIVRQHPELCSHTKRVNNTGLGAGTFVRKGVVHVHPHFCSELHPVYRIPLKVFTNKRVFMK